MHLLLTREDQFYEQVDGSMIICGECLDFDIEETKEGKLKGDEAVYEEDWKRVSDDDTEAYQCDDCMYQNAAYDELD